MVHRNCCKADSGLIRRILARDCGGTQCTTLLIDEDGTIIGRGQVNIRDSLSGRDPRGSGRSSESIRAATEQALKGTYSGELHITTSFSEIHESLESAGKTYFYTILEADSIYALAGVDYGLVALAGTGAFVHGRTSDGRELHLDSIGPILGDYGSAFYIGRLALRAAARSDWHPRHETALRDAVYEACGGEIENEEKYLGYGLVEFTLRNPDRAEIASLASIVDDYARKGDSISCEILRKAAEALSESVRDVIDRLGIQNEDYTLIGAGGVITNSDLYWKYLKDSVSKFSPKLKLIRTKYPPVLGIAIATAKEVGVGDIDSFRDNLFKSFTGK